MKCSENNCDGVLKLKGAAGAAGRLRYRCNKCGRTRWGRGKQIGRQDADDIQQEHEQIWGKS